MEYVNVKGKPIKERTIQASSVSLARNRGTGYTSFRGGGSRCVRVNGLDTLWTLLTLATGLWAKLTTQSHRL